MKNILNLGLFTVLVTLFYTYVGQMVPQQESYPPPEVQIRADMSVEEMVAVGQIIVEGKGVCLGCHTIGSDQAGRFPDLGGIGARAGSRRPGMTDIEYLTESLYDPGAYIVEGFLPGMPAANRPPVGLSDQEILVVLAYLQSLGGTPSVSMDTKREPSGSSGEAVASASTAATAAGTRPTGELLFETLVCHQCHSLRTTEKRIGPSLFGVGSRMTEEEIRQSIMQPDSVVRDGYPALLMKMVLESVQFYGKYSDEEVDELVDYLVAQRVPEGADPMLQESPAAGASPAEAIARGGELFERYMCTQCHTPESAARGIGPSLEEVGNRLSAAELRQSIMDPDVVTVEGFPTMLMRATLSATQFYGMVLEEELSDLIVFLQAEKGDK